MEPKSGNSPPKIKSFTSIATFIVLVIVVGALTINFVMALVDKLN